MANVFRYVSLLDEDGIMHARSTCLPDSYFFNNLSQRRETMTECMQFVRLAAVPQGAVVTCMSCLAVMDDRTLSVDRRWSP